MKYPPYVFVDMHAYVALSNFYTNLHISFIYEDIVAKFAENVYGYENMSVKHFVLIVKNKMATIADCSKIINMF